MRIFSSQKRYWQEVILCKGAGALNTSLVRIPLETGCPRGWGGLHPSPTQPRHKLIKVEIGPMMIDEDVDDDAILMTL